MRICPCLEKSKSIHAVGVHQRTDEQRQTEENEDQVRKINAATTLLGFGVSFSVLSCLPTGSQGLIFVNHETVAANK